MYEEGWVLASTMYGRETDGVAGTKAMFLELGDLVFAQSHPFSVVCTFNFMDLYLRL